MVLTFLLALFFAGAALALVARAAALPRIRTDESVGRIAAYGYSTAPADAASTAAEREPVIPRAAAAVGWLLFRGTPAKRQEQLRKTILQAGAWNTSAMTVLGYRAVATMLLGGSACYTGLSAGWPLPITVIATGYAGATGWIGPMFLLKGRARRRTDRIELDLPELVDLLVVTLEAGVGFNAALQRSAERMSGPLGDEIRLTLHEHELGLAMERALANLLDRCDVPAIRAFVRAVVQSERLGISIGQVMRDLSGDMRKRRRQIVEERAHKAPIKLLFPLAFLILPALLLVILYPGLYTITQTLGG